MPRPAVAGKVGAELLSESEATFKAYGYKAENIAEALRKSDHSEMFVDADFLKAMTDGRNLAQSLHRSSISLVSMISDLMY